MRIGLRTELDSSLFSFNNFFFVRQESGGLKTSFLYAPTLHNITFNSCGHNPKFTNNLCFVTVVNGRRESMFECRASQQQRHPARYKVVAGPSKVDLGRQYAVPSRQKYIPTRLLHVSWWHLLFIKKSILLVACNQELAKLA